MTIFLILIGFLIFIDIIFMDDINVKQTTIFLNFLNFFNAFLNSFFVLIIITKQYGITELRGYSGRILAAFAEVFRVFQRHAEAIQLNKIDERLQNLEPVAVTFDDL